MSRAPRIKQWWLRTKQWVISRRPDAWLVALSPLLLYIAWCIVGFKLLGGGPAQISEWQISRALTRGHRIVADDVKRASDAAGFEHSSQSLDQLLGRYLTRDMAQDAPVSSADVAAQPVIDPAPGSLVYFAPLANNSELRSYLDAGSHLTLCWSEDAECIPDRVVIAVTCNDEGTACTAITTIPKDKLNLVDSSDKLRLLLHR